MSARRLTAGNSNSDGTYTLHFGYFNRNTEEELDVPIGPDNSFDPGGDRGQPTHFYPVAKMVGVQGGRAQGLAERPASWCGR